MSDPASVCTILRPFLKWPGGKARLLKILAPYIQPNKILVEPFVGAGSIFLNSSFENYVLNDINRDLITIFNFIKNDPQKFIQQARKLFQPRFNCKEVYYQRRAQFNTSSKLLEKAALFLYLNKHGYNGLCRYNTKGLYNVPFGSYKTIAFPEKEIQTFSLKSQNAQFHQLSFESFFECVEREHNPRDLTIYCDPPYAPLSETANFTNYSAQKFSLTHQKQLADLAFKLSQKGACVLISNHDTHFTRQLYKKAKLISFEVQRGISCKGHNRTKVKELLAIYGR